MVPNPTPSCPTPPQATQSQKPQQANYNNPKKSTPSSPTNHQATPSCLESPTPRVKRGCCQQLQWQLGFHQHFVCGGPCIFRAIGKMAPSKSSGLSHLDYAFSHLTSPRPTPSCPNPTTGAPNPKLPNAKVPTNPIPKLPTPSSPKFCPTPGVGRTQPQATKS